MPRVSEHIEWLNLIDRSGPFLVPAVLEEKFPQGLEKIETPRKQRVRSAYEEWRDAIDESDPQLSDIHNAWIAMVLQDLLEYENEVLVGSENLVGKCVYKAPEHGIEISPDFAVRGDDGKYKILISYWPPETDLEKPVSIDSWPASPLDRMTLLCRANNVRTGLVTDGERWMLVNAPVGGVSGYAAWLARLWWQEPVTLKAFQSLLGVRRCFGPAEDTLDSMLERSTAFQEEVTDTLGEQVRRAVEILIQSLGRADQDRNGDLLRDVDPKGLYEAGLTVMMRLVFTLCAEERGLLLLGDPIYDQFYAISTLRAILREEADRLGIEVLERRHDAWSRLLSTFRAIYGGVEHESLRMPAMGGSLFDPDRFPFLEGRARGTKWKENSAIPLPIDNRTVLLLLEALQILEQKGGAQLLSYRALDVEQIGHVYEGLLECTVARLDEVTIGLIGSQKVRHPSTTLKELETQREQGSDKIVPYLMELTKRSASTIKKALEKETDESIFHRLIHACGGDETLADRLLPFVYLFDEDSWGTFLVYRAGAFAVVRGSSRRETGAHYTPKSLTEPIVQHTLEPIVYVGPSEGKSQKEWVLKTSTELLSLKVCDMAMGSAAFLVQACRWLGERVVEAWETEEKSGKFISIEGSVICELGMNELLPKDKSERILIARRLVASRCLYGVDINPMAVELGKMSLWLVTMMKNRPFNFLDHALKCGDSLLGVSNLEQIANFSLRSGQKQSTFATASLLSHVENASTKRKLLESLPSNDLTQIESKNQLFAEASAELAALKYLADCLVAFELENFDGDQYENKRIQVALQIEVEMQKPLFEFQNFASNQLQHRNPFHWAIEFPEVFLQGGFDAFIGNPPYMGGQKISGSLGTDFRNFLVINVAQGRRGSADLCVYFVLRTCMLCKANGCVGLVVTSGITEGESQAVGLAYLDTSGVSKIIRAISRQPWPGGANVTYSITWLFCGLWKAPLILDNTPVVGITPALEEVTEVIGKPKQLKSNYNKSFQGSITLGPGFIISREQAEYLISKDFRNKSVVFPYLTGEEVNSDPYHCGGRYAINFGEMSEHQAREYSDCFAIVEERVRPERMLKDVKKYPRMVNEWWKYWCSRPELYKAITNKKWVLAIASKATKYVAFAQVSPLTVFSDALSIIVTDVYSDFSVLSSNLHEVWCRRHGGYNLLLLRYAPFDLFETFPFPQPTIILENIGKHYSEYRAEIMHNRAEGLTNILNRVNNSNDNSEDISKLRALHTEMDQAVADAYGWNDIDLGHDFQETKQGIRFTINETARRIVLDRLLALNHKRYEEEVKAGLHDKKTMKKTVAKKKDSKIDAPELF